MGKSYAEVKRKQFFWSFKGVFSSKILDLAQESIVKVTNSLFCEELLEYSSECHQHWWDTAVEKTSMEVKKRALDNVNPMPTMTMFKWTCQMMKKQQPIQQIHNFLHRKKILKHITNNSVVVKFV